MNRCPRCGRMMQGSVCRYCGQKLAPGWETPELEIEGESRPDKKMFKYDATKWRCWYCGVPITPDMLETGEAEIRHGRFYCKLHARKRDAALRSTFSSASEQRRWATSFSSHNIATKIVIVVIAVVAGLARACVRTGGSFSCYHSRQPPRSICALSVEEYHIVKITEVLNDLYRADVAGEITNHLPKTINRVLMKVELFLPNGEGPFMGGAVIERLRPFETRKWLGGVMVKGEDARVLKERWDEVEIRVKTTIVD